MLLPSLLFISKYGITMLACANGPGVDDIANKDATIANLARMGYLQNDFHCRIKENIATHDSDSHTLNHVGTVLHSAVYPFLTALTNAMDVVVLKPIDVRRKQGCFYLLELRLPNNCFNLFHTLKP